MSLQQIFLENYDSDTLADFLKLCAAVIPHIDRPTRKEPRAQCLADTLLNPMQLQQIWTAMDDLSRKAVASAYHNGGAFVADAFIAQYGRLPERPTLSAWYYASSPILLDLFIHRGQIPPELMSGLDTLVPSPERFQVVGVEDIDAIVKANGGLLDGIMIAETEQTGLHDLLLFLQLCDQRAVNLNSTSERLTPTSVTTLLENLLHGDFYSPAYLETDWPSRLTDAKSSGKAKGMSKAKDTIRPFGLTTFAKGAGLITRYGGGLTELGRAYLASQDPALLLDAFETWTKVSEFDEITRIDAIKGLRSRGIHLTNPGMRRERIVEALSWCPVNVWIDIAEFYRALKIWRFDFQIEEGGIEKLYIGYRYGGSGYYEPWANSQDMWLLINGLYINAVLWEYLAVIGALDIAYFPPGEVDLAASLYANFEDEYYSMYDGLFFFRINPLGAYLFGQAGDFHAATVVDAPLLRVDADQYLKILDPTRLTPVIKNQLEQIATLEEADVYRLDPEKLLLALEQGADREALGDFLTRNSGEPVPPAVNSWLDQVHNASRAFSVDVPMLRIRAATNELVQLVLADPELGKFCQSLGNRRLVIPANREDRFRLRLRQLGYGLR